MNVSHSKYSTRSASEQPVLSDTEGTEIEHDEFNWNLFPIYILITKNYL